MKFLIILIDNSFSSLLLKALSWCENFEINVFAASLSSVEVKIFASIISRPDFSRVFVNFKKRPFELSTLINISSKLSNLFLHATTRSQFLF